MTNKNQSVKTAEEIKIKNEQMKTNFEVLNEECSKDTHPTAPARISVKDYAGGSDEYVRTDIAYIAMESYASQSLPQPDNNYWQLCPKCNGDGHLGRYNSPALSNTTTPVCDVCDGAKILATPQPTGGMPVSLEQDGKVLDLLIRLNEYMDDRKDVKDGDYGVPKPNSEMKFYVELEEIIKELEK